MDDGFEYRLVDYGVGRLQPRDNEGSLSPRAFWMKLRITNTSEHLLREPWYSTSIRGIKISDNWGNTYEARSPLAVYGVDRDSSVASAGGGGRFKPGEARYDIWEISVSEFVADIHELRVYLNFPYVGERKRSERYHVFVLREPMSRRRDWLRDQSEPSATELPVTTGVETWQPSTTPSRHRSSGPQR